MHFSLGAFLWNPYFDCRRDRGFARTCSYGSGPSPLYEASYRTPGVLKQGNWPDALAGVKCSQGYVKLEGRVWFGSETLDANFSTGNGTRTGRSNPVISLMPPQK